MIQRRNLRFMVYSGNGTIWLETRNPRDVHLRLSEKDWLFNGSYGGQFRIGSGIRVDDDDYPLPGTIFVFDWTNPQQRNKSVRIRREIEQYGRLFTA